MGGNPRFSRPLYQSLINSIHLAEVRGSHPASGGAQNKTLYVSVRPWSLSSKKKEKGLPTHGGGGGLA